QGGARAVVDAGGPLDLRGGQHVPEGGRIAQPDLPVFKGQIIFPGIQNPGLACRHVVRRVGIPAVGLPLQRRDRSGRVTASAGAPATETDAVSARASPIVRRLMPVHSSARFFRAVRNGGRGRSPPMKISALSRAGRRDPSMIFVSIPGGAYARAIVSLVWHAPTQHGWGRPIPRSPPILRQAGNLGLCANSS